MLAWFDQITGRYFCKRNSTKSLERLRSSDSSMDGIVFSFHFQFHTKTIFNHHHIYIYVGMYV